MSIIAIVCGILALCFTLFCGVFVCLKTTFSREKYKVYAEHFYISDVLKKLVKLAMTDICSLKRKLVKLNEGEDVRSAWTDQATLYRIRAGIAVHVRHAQFVCRLVQFAVRLLKARLIYSYIRPPGSDVIVALDRK